MILNDHTVRADDGTSIAYAVAGSGPALVLTNGLTTTSFFWKYLRPRWLAKYTVVTWDLPGHGRSSPARSARTASIEGQPALLTRVLDAAGIEQGIQLGWSVGCQVVLELHRQAPGRCRALGLLFGPAERALGSTALPISGHHIYEALREPQGMFVAGLFQRIAPICTLPGGLAVLRRLRILGPHTSRADLRELLEELTQVDPHTVCRMARSAQEHSALDELRSVRVPVLIMAGEHDPFAPAETVGVALERALPHARLVRVAGATHTALLDEPDAIAAAVDAFVSEQVVPR